MYRIVSEMKSAFVFLVCLVAATDANTVSEKASSIACNSSFSGSSGIITSPNYPNTYVDNLDCFEQISASSGKLHLSLIFTSFETESCCDFVTVSCPSNSSFSRKQFTGYSIPDPVSIPSCTMGLLNFRTDDSVVASGFSLDYYVSSTSCEKTLYSGSNGYVTSPYYPSNYGNSQDCYYVIWNTQRSTFSLQFKFFSIESTSSCGYDWLEISCKDNSTFVPQRRCGTTPFNMTIYGCSRVLMWFHSSSSGTFGGFNITYDVYPDSGSTLPTATTTANSLCGLSDYFGWTGVISSPNFPGSYYNYLYCFYYINALRDSTITLIFDSFNIQSGADFVKISCQSNSSYPPSEYSGYSLPAPVSIPWCSQGLIHLRTDYTTVDTGFSINYYLSEGGCGETVYTAFTGYVTSPSYPSNYGNNQNCSNIIWAPQPSTFYLFFHQLQMDFDCNRDWLEIGCSDYAAYDPYRFCGQYYNISLNISGCNQLLLWFHSDGSTNYKGFNIQYSVFPDPETTGNTETTKSTTYTTPYPGTTANTGTTKSTTYTTPDPGTTKVTSGITDTPQSTPTPPVTECGQTSYSGSSGFISSPNHPGDYPNDLSCDYYIDASSSSSSIAIIFQDFNTQQGIDYVTIGCPTNFSYPSLRYSGSSLPPPFSFPWCSQGAVNFITDDSVVSTGFSLDYHVSLGGCGDTLHRESNGFVSSPNHPNNYGVNQNCSNIIWASQRSSFSVNFQDMEVEECCDFVELSCLDNAESGSYRFTGTSIPPKLNIPGCTKLLVWFYTDDSVVLNGFQLEYFVTPDSG